MKYTILISSLIFIACSSNKEISNPITFQLKNGDLLFQDSDCGAFCTSIEKVTFGYKGAKLSHIGMVIINEEKEIKIIEAVSAGVVLTPIDEFLNRSRDHEGNSKVLVGRIDNNHQALIPDAITFAQGKLGLSYDEIFDITNNKYYCSELIYDAFKYAHADIPLFYLKPMTFIDPDTGDTFPIWANYYQDLGVNIPEGKPGLNPGGISLSKYIEIIHAYGIPDGFNPKTGN